MALFRKDPAEKKLKELTGGVFLNTSFLDRLKKAGLTAADGVEIQREVKKDIKSGEVKEEGVETRINFLIEQKKADKLGVKSSQNDLTKNTRYMGDNKSKASNRNQNENTKEIEILTADSLEHMAKDDRVKEMKFLVNQEHNLKECPKCGAKILQYDTFCFNCGCEIRKAMFDKGFEKTEGKSESTLDINKESKSTSDINKETKSTADELSQLEQQYTETKAAADELSELEKLYNKKVSTRFSPKFKFAYVLYLDEINKNPNKSIKNDYYKANYDTSLTKIKKQAREDEFIGEGSPLIAAKSATVKDLKKLLKEHDLMVSGTKDELIERLGENLTEEELKEVFPKKVFAVSEKGLEFIEENKYVFYYDKTTPIRSYVEVEEYDSVFDDVDDLSDENIHKLLIDFLEKREDELVSKKNWAGYRYNFMALARVYKDSGNEFKVLDNDFKLFIAGINNFNDYTNHSEPAYGYIGKTYSKELIELLHSLSLSIDDLKAKFNDAYDDLKYPELKISKDESLVYLLKLFSGEDIQDLTEEIHSKYPDSNLGYSY